MEVNNKTHLKSVALAVHLTVPVKWNIKVLPTATTYVHVQCIHVRTHLHLMSYSEEELQ